MSNPPPHWPPSPRVRLNRCACAQAAGLGHGAIVDEILQRAQNAAAVTDAEGRTALHFAALAKDGGEVYNKLVRAGADELAQDHVRTANRRGRGARIDDGSMESGPHKVTRGADWNSDSGRS